jgi:N-acetyl-anhydromuramyl-L-alanine amidase AmpD
MIHSTPLWQRQADGAHIFLVGHNFNTSSIGICLLGDTAEQAPSPEQMKALVTLVRALQWQCNIPPERVYLHGNLTGATCPGGLFPVEGFRSRLFAFSN